MLRIQLSKSLGFQNKRFFSYAFKDVETKWSTTWKERDSRGEYKQTKFDPNAGAEEKFYCLAQFPYPSGKLHMGHARVYFITDTITRFERLRDFVMFIMEHFTGKKVLNPMGWDSFGLPAENAAIERNIEPSEWTEANIKEMRADMDNLGLEFDWEHELSTCDPAYYKWTQWLFLKLYEKGYVSKKEGYVNWDPVDNTVLANEQVDANGCSWRSGAKVVRKQMNQWYFRITKLAKELHDDLDTLPDWPGNVKEMQKGWIGLSQGTEVLFELYDKETGQTVKDLTIPIFTTRVDTLFGVTFLGLSFEHPLSKGIVDPENRAEFEKQLAEITSKQEVEKKMELQNEEKVKSGIKINRYEAVHPLTGQRVPLFICNYVLADYGSGAIMGVPAHDQRDKLFAEGHQLPIIKVIAKGEDGVERLINSNGFDNQTIEEATKNLTTQLEKEGKGQKKEIYSLRDWSVSRQRYWGAPIPMISVEGEADERPVEEDELPVTLPTKIKSTSLLKTGSALREDKNYYLTTDKKTNKPAVRSTDTLDTFVDSSWYFLRFFQPNSQDKIFDKEVVSRWMPVDCYIGGIEHAIMHLLYARFIYKFLHKEGYISGYHEPFKQLIPQGLVKSKTYKDKSTGKFLLPEEAAAFPKENLAITVEKMSKSKKNGINPRSFVQENGSDCLRLALFFYGPNEKDISWEESIVKTIKNFLDRIDSSVSSACKAFESVPKSNFESLEAIRKNIGSNQEKLKFLMRFLEILSSMHHAMYRKERHLHVAVARAMEIVNFFTEHKDKLEEYSECFAICHKLFAMNLYPIAPFIAAESWHMLGSLSCLDGLNDNITGDLKKEVRLQKIVSPEEIQKLMIPKDLPLNVNIFVDGKSRGNMKVDSGIFENDELLQNFVINEVKVKALQNKTVKKILRVSSNKKVHVVNFLTE